MSPKFKKPQEMSQYEISDLICIYYAKMNKDDYPEYKNYPSDLHLLSDVFGRKYKGYTNQKDTFDAFFENGRKGWYQRTLRQQGPHFEKSYKLYKDIPVSELKPIVDEAREYLISVLEKRGTNDQFDVYLSDFIDNHLDDAIKHENEMEKIRQQFLTLFPKDKIMEMKLSDYAIGTKGENKNWDKTFCYFLETRLKPLGSILGATSLKFGVYWEKANHKYVFAKGYIKDRTEDEAFTEIKKEIASLIKLGAEKDFKKIQENSISPMFKSKILVTYYPEQYLNIYDKDDIDSILSKLNIPFSVKLPLEEEKQLLLDFKNSDERMKPWSNYVYSCFLFKYFRTVTAKDNTTEKTITLMVFSIVGKHQKKKSVSNHEPDYRKAYEAKVAVGLSGEKMVEKYEKERLKHLKCKKWKDVEIISTKNPHAGYDVESFESDDKPLHIEVKTTSKASINLMDFYLTDNEYQEFLKDPYHVIYYLCGIKTNNVKLFRITRDNFKNVEPEPVLYKVSLDIESKEVK